MSLAAGVLALALLIAPLPVLAEEDVLMEDAERMLFVPNRDRLKWQIINDGVMGGVSESRWNMTDDHVFVFTGNVSLENNGGFASVRTQPFDFGFQEVDAFSLLVRGDGKTYKLRFRTDDRWDGISYSADFKTTDSQWMEVVLPLENFEPTFRGRDVPDAPALEPSRIRQAGFLISDKQKGPFRLEVAAVVPLYKTEQKDARNY